MTCIFISYQPSVNHKILCRKKIQKNKLLNSQIIQEILKFVMEMIFINRRKKMFDFYFFESQKKEYQTTTFFNALRGLLNII
jgi:hypothetical protein